MQAPVFVLGPSFRGEVGLDVLRTLAIREVRVAADAQGWVHVIRDGRLHFEPWPEMPEFLAHLAILKVDAVEAEALTGERDPLRAAQRLAGYGPREVVLTHRDGLVVYAQGQVHRAGFFPSALIGRSGRGDTCLAAYTARRLTADPGRATVWAAAVTSLKMEAEGPFRRDAAEVEALIRARYAAPVSA